MGCIAPSAEEKKREKRPKKDHKFDFSSSCFRYIYIHIHTYRESKRWSYPELSTMYIYI